MIGVIRAVRDISIRWLDRLSVYVLLNVPQRNRHLAGFSGRILPLTWRPVSRP